MSAQPLRLCCGKCHELLSDNFFLLCVIDRQSVTCLRCEPCTSKIPGEYLIKVRVDPGITYVMDPADMDGMDSIDGSGTPQRG